MRYLNKRNKKSFIIFGVSISFILVIFSIFILKYDKNKSAPHVVSTGSVMYDKDENHIKTEEEGKIDKIWNGEYNLKVGDKKYSLGNQAIVYETNTNKLISYGNIYQVMEDASVVAEGEATDISQSSDLCFYKLADRKYLVVGKEIKIPDQDLKTENYLLVNVDKGGTSKVYNDKLNLKILEPVEIKFGNYTFDVANEVLNTDKEEIALAKIGGSTSEYLDIAEANDTKDDKKNNNNENTLNDGSVLNNGSVTNNTTTNNNTNNTNNNQNNNLVGDLSGLLGNNNNNSQNNSQNNSNNNSDESTIKKESTLRINYISSGISELGVNYSILDYEDKYSAVYLIVEDSTGDKKNIILSKDENTRTIYGLQPDTQYSVSIGATISKLVGGVEENEDIIIDTVKTRTSELDVKLTVERFSSEMLQFKLKVNNDLNLESGKVVLYADGSKIAEKDINGESAITSKGWVDSFKLEDIQSVKILTIKIEDAVYNGQPIAINNELTIQNSFLGNTVRTLKNMFNKLLKGEI